MNPWTQYDIDMRPPDNDPEVTVAILRNGKTLVYAVGPNPGYRSPNARPAWALIRLDCELGTSVAARQTYASFIEATRAFRAGAVIWGDRDGRAQNSD